MARTWDIPDRPILCHLLHIGCQTIDPAWRFSLRSPYWRLYHNRERGAAILHPGGRSDLVPGRLYLLPAWGDYRSRCRRRVRHLYLHFRPRGLLGEWAEGRWRVPVAVAPDRGLADLAAYLHGRPTGPAMHLRAQALVVGALAAAVDALPAADREALDVHLRQPSPVDAAVDHIRDHPEDDLRTPRLAALCGYSPDHFARLLRRRTGRSPARYVREQRIAAAAEVLLSTDASIEAVAAAHGFADRYHFTRVFTAEVGRPPAAYRRAGRV